MRVERSECEARILETELVHELAGFEAEVCKFLSIESIDSLSEGEVSGVEKDAQVAGDEEGGWIWDVEAASEYFGVTDVVDASEPHGAFVYGARAEAVYEVIFCVLDGTSDGSMRASGAPGVLSARREIGDRFLDRDEIERI